MNLRAAKLIGLAFGVFAAICAAESNALTIVVANPGFEDVSGQSTFNEFTFGVPAGWNLHDPSSSPLKNGRNRLGHAATAG